MGKQIGRETLIAESQSQQGFVLRGEMHKETIVSLSLSLSLFFQGSSKFSSKLFFSYFGVQEGLPDRANKNIYTKKEFVCLKSRFNLVTLSSPDHSLPPSSS